MEVGQIVKLRPISQKLKNRIREHGPERRVVRFHDEWGWFVKCLCEHHNEKTSFSDWRWVKESEVERIENGEEKG